MIAVAVGGVAYVALVIASSWNAGPRGWGLHAPGFLPVPLRVVVLLALAGFAAMLVLSALRPVPSIGAAERGAKHSRLWLPVLLLPFGALLWILRARTQLLGDGTVWLATARSGEHRAYSEPLFAALWHGFATIVKWTGHAPDASRMSLLSVACGIAAVPILAGLAKEIAPSKGRWVIPFALLLTLGISQLWFGYIESYPAAAVFILIYLWLALRRARGADPSWVVALALALAIAAHLSALYLVPSYLILVWIEKRPAARKLVDLVLPLLILGALFLVLRYRPSDWVAPFLAATRGMREGFERATFHRPYGFLSYGHLADLLNIVLLAMPAPALLLLGWIVGVRGRIWRLEKDLTVLAAAAIPGALLLVGLMTPVAPAQDWDLESIFLLPAAVLGVAAGQRLWAERRNGAAVAGLVGLSAVSLFSYVMVNASETRAVQRFGAVVSDPGRVSRYGRSYGASILELYYRDRREFASALSYARAAVDAEPTNPRNWTNVGYELMELGRYDEAVPFLREGIRRGPARWEGRYNLGLTLMKLGRYEEAVPPLREAVAIQGNLPVVRHNLGLALYRSGHTDEAVVVWREILARWPSYAASLQVPGGTPAP